MTYILSADWHAHNWSQFSSFGAGGVNNRLAHILIEIELMAAHAEDNGITNLFVAGDVFHVRGSVKPSVLNPVLWTLKDTARVHNVHWFIMPGNHDLEGKESETLGSAIEALGIYGGVTLVHKPMYFTEGDDVAMVPWSGTREGLEGNVTDLREEIIAKGLNPLRFDLILHTGINGVLIGVPDNGWSPEELANFGFGRVFAGHYHNHKAFNIPIEGFDVPVVSIGALTHQTWSDVDTKAGWLVVDVNGFEHFESLAPKFVDFDPDFPGSYAGNYVRVQGLSLEEAEIKVLREHLDIDGAAGVVIHAIAKSKVVLRPGTSVAAGASVDVSISQWIKSAEIENAPAVEKLALEILNEARGA